VLDTLHGAGRIIRIEVRRIGSRATDEKVGHGCAGFVSAQDLESPETCLQFRAHNRRSVTNLGNLWRRLALPAWGAN